MAANLHLVAPLTVGILRRYPSQAPGPVARRIDWQLASQDSAGWEGPCFAAAAAQSMQLVALEIAAAVLRVSDAPAATFGIAGAGFAHRYLKSHRWRSAVEA